MTDTCRRCGTPKPFDGNRFCVRCRVVTKTILVGAFFCGCQGPNFSTYAVRTEAGTSRTAADSSTVERTAAEGPVLPSTDLQRAQSNGEGADAGRGTVVIRLHTSDAAIPPGSVQASPADSQIVTVLQAQTDDAGAPLYDAGEHDSETQASETTSLGEQSVSAWESKLADQGLARCPRLHAAVVACCSEGGFEFRCDESADCGCDDGATMTGLCHSWPTLPFSWRCN